MCTSLKNIALVFYIISKDLLLYRSVKFNWESGKSMARLVLGYGIYEGGG
nr:MAG TPA: hypothetical protein [Caudoviricetes sp.]